MNERSDPIRGPHPQDSPGAADRWFHRYPLTPEDAEFLWHMHGRTLLPTWIRIPSGKLVTGTQVRQWFDWQRALRQGPLADVDDAR